MTNIASVLKDEITRLARKEQKLEGGTMRKSITRHRADIAALKRRVALIEQRLGRLEKAPPAQPAVALQTAIAKTPRFRADGLRMLMNRMDITAPVLAQILGVSAQTIYNWCAGVSRPDPVFTERLAILRKMGKKEFNQRLRQMRETHRMK